MDQRHAVAIGHLTTLRLLDFPMDCDYEARAEVFIVRCRAARAKINEDVEGLSAAEVAESLLRQEGEWLGEQVGYKSKTVKCSERTLLKVVKLWSKRQEWTWRQFAGLYSLLLCASGTLDMGLGPHFAALKFLRTAASSLASNPAAWDAQVGVVPTAVIEDLQGWVKIFSDSTTAVQALPKG
jgi:hypothetical protein